ncbi:hypothetical protein Hdeb2414_s0001g00015011 [Helianthus debilis subsp. tardiflorus]
MLIVPDVVLEKNPLHILFGTVFTSRNRCGYRPSQTDTFHRPSSLSSGHSLSATVMLERRTITQSICGGKSAQLGRIYSPSRLRINKVVSLFQTKVFILSVSLL